MSSSVSHAPGTALTWEGLSMKRRCWCQETSIGVSPVSLTSLSSPQGEMGPKGESGIAGHRGPTGRPGKRGKQVRASGFAPTEVTPRGLEVCGEACGSQLEPSHSPALRHPQDWWTEQPHHRPAFGLLTAATVQDYRLCSRSEVRVGRVHLGHRHTYVLTKAPGNEGG